MKYSPKAPSELPKVDMTPMIDVVFQLMSFFLFVLSFSGAEQSEAIRLPASELAKPPQAPPASPLTIQLTSQGNVIYGGEENPPGQDALLWLKVKLLVDRQIIAQTPGRSVAEATIIIRADRSAKTGRVQELMQLCQEPALGFQKFKLRAKQEASLSPKQPEKS